MPDQYVTHDAFERWATRLDEKFDKVIERHNDDFREMGERVKALETNQHAAAWLAATLSGLIAALVGGIVTLFGGSK